MIFHKLILFSSSPQPELLNAHLLVPVDANKLCRICFLCFQLKESADCARRVDSNEAFEVRRGWSRSSLTISPLPSVGDGLHLLPICFEFALKRSSFHVENMPKFHDQPDLGYLAEHAHACGLSDRA